MCLTGVACWDKQFDQPRFYVEKILSNCEVLNVDSWRPCVDCEQAIVIVEFSYCSQNTICSLKKRKK